MDDDTLYLASLSGEELQNFIVGSAAGYHRFSMLVRLVSRLP
jgi:hypothetical protein